MKKIAALVFTILLNGTLSAQLLFQLTDDSLLTYSYSGGDEFNAGKLDEEQWISGMGWTRVLMSQKVAFSPKKVIFDKGLLNLETTLEDSTYILTPWEVDSSMLKKEKYVLTDRKFRTTYVSGSIISRKKYHYGLYELRFKVDAGKGVWPAFWFFGGNKNEEIDAFELKDEKNNTIHVDTHCPRGCDHGYKNKFGFGSSYGGWMPVSAYLHEGFNIMQLEWKPEEVIWYLNGYPMAYFRGAFANPMNLYINSNVAADGRAFSPGPDSTTPWPNRFLVDYVRVWQPQQNASTVVLKASPGAGVAEAGASLYSTKPTKKSGLMYWRRKLNPYQGMVSLTLGTDNKLTVCVLGRLAEQNAVVTIKTAGGILEVKDVTKESEFQLSPQDAKLELDISAGDKHYSQAVLLER